jgi:signal transduction histidine kinase
MVKPTNEATAKEKERIRRELVVTAKHLATTAKEKERIRRNLVITATTAKEMEIANFKLKGLDKLKDDLLSFTAHELKAPLVPIKSQAQILLAGGYGKLNQEQTEALEMIHRSEEQLNKLISGLLDLSRIRANRFNLALQSTALNGIITGAVKDAGNHYEQNHVALSLLPIPELPNTLADGLRLGQVMRNLLDNALKFTPEEGRVSVEIKKTQKDIVITVKDSGIGIAAENIDKLFTPFFQIDSGPSRKYRGVGLGLAIAKGIIEAHGGKIWAESAGLGQGSTFSFSLGGLNNLAQRYDGNICHQSTAACRAKSARKSAGGLRRECRWPRSPLD